MLRRDKKILNNNFLSQYILYLFLNFIKNLSIQRYMYGGDILSNLRRLILIIQLTDFYFQQKEANF